MSAAPPPGGAPVIPPPPPKEGKKYKRNADLRWLMWPAALLAGVALGVLGYAIVPFLSSYFDYWVARISS